MRKFLTFTLVFLFLFSSFSLPALAQDTEESGLTLEKAIEMALSHSPSLKQADYDVDRSEEVKELAERQANLVVPPGPITIDVWTVVTNAHVKNLSWRMAEKTRDITRDSVTMSAFQKYIDVLKAQEALSNAEKACSAAKRKYAMEQARYSVGMSSKLSVSQVQAQHSTASATLEAAKKSMDTAYQNLNYLLGLPSDKRLPLVDKPQYNPTTVTDVMSRIEQIIDDSPALWLKDSSADMAKMTLSMYNWSTATEPYEAKHIDLKKAELTALDAKDQARLLLNSTHASIKNLEENYTAAQLSLQTAQENLRIQKLMFDAGMNTQTDVMDAEVEVAKAQKALDDIIYQHEILKLAFVKPWAYTASND